MNYVLLREIIDQLSVINPYKARKLEMLLNKLNRENDQEKKKELEKRINLSIFNLFGKCLTKKDRDDFYNTSTWINEECYAIEQNEKNRWFIFSDGARRYVNTDEGIIVSNYIPREYGMGFHLDESDTSKSSEDVLIEAAFIKKYQNRLDIIGRLMDHKEELITDNYCLRDSSIPRFFVEELIDFLGIHRIQNTKNNTK